MDQKLSVDADLQKAIDDITKTTSVDPVFTDPVAAPSSIPEGDTGEMGEPIGPFPTPEPEPIAAPEPEPVAPIAPAMPDFTVPDLPPIPEPAPEPIFEPFKPEVPAGLEIEQIKEAALRDLIPLLDKMNLDPRRKFRIYRDIFDTLHDYKVLEPAYRMVAELPTDKERGEALLFLINAIDRM